MSKKAYCADVHAKRIKKQNKTYKKKKQKPNEKQAFIDIDSCAPRNRYLAVGAHPHLYLRYNSLSRCAAH